MKKFLLIVMLLLWAAGSWGSVTVTIGTGTTLTGSVYAEITPYKNYWEDGQDQILFTAGELAAAGLGAGNIEKLAFNVGGSPSSQTLYSFTISAQQFSGSILTSFLTSGWTQCFIGNVVASSGWNTYTFTTPFFWDGTSNIVFKVCYNNNSWTSNSEVYYTSTPSSGVHLSWGSDLPTSSGCDVLTNTYNVPRPNVQITGHESDPCTGTPDPGNTISSAYLLCPTSIFTLSLQNATLGSGLIYQWQKSATGTDPWTNVGTSASIYTTSQTSSNYYRCQVTCSGNTGISNPVLVSCGPPDPGNTVSSANPVCSGSSFTLSLQNATGGIEIYQWQKSSTGGDPWTNIGTNNPTCVISQTASTFYRCVLSCGGGNVNSNPVEVSLSPIFNCYCASRSNNPSDEKIFSVTVGAVTNAYNCTTIAPGPGSILNQYANFFPLGPIFTLPQSTAVPFTILEDECDGPQYYPNGCCVWVDFNQDGDFTDADENVYSETGLTISPRTISGAINVPAGALLGTTAMRITVAEAYSGSFSPCLIYSYGETEDYKVSIIPQVTCPQPYNLAATSVTISGVNLSWTPGGSETGWEFVYGLSPLPVPSDAGTATSSHSANPITGLSPNTAYQYYVRADCGTESSNWSGPYTFKTLCESIPAPISENFDVGVTMPYLPDCWYKIVNSSSGATVETSNACYNPPYGIKLFNSVETAAPLLLITPELSTPINSLQVRFLAAGSPGATVLMGTISDPANASSFTQVASVPIATYWTEQIVSFSSYNGTDHYIAFKHGAGIINVYIYIDNIDIYTPSSLEGFVYDSDGIPIPGASITRVGGISAVSGPDGSYTLSPLPFGYQEFLISRTGYNDADNFIDIPQGTTVNQNFTLTNPEMTVTPPSLYEVLLPGQIATTKLNIANMGSGSLGWSALISYGSGEPLAPRSAYCLSTHTNCGQPNNEYISRVILNTIDNPSSCIGYSDYTGLSTNVKAGSTYSINLRVGNPYNGDLVSGWIDWNQNGIFDEAPIVFTGNIFATMVGAFTVPDDALAGATRLRINLTYNNTPQPCGTEPWGETEDYTVNIINTLWLSMDKFSGTVFPGDDQYSVAVQFDANKAEQGGGVIGKSYSAAITFSSFPDIGTVTVPVTMTIADASLESPTGLRIFIVNAGDGKFMLMWNFNPGRSNPHFIILRNDELIGTSTNNKYLDDLELPGHYCYKVCRVYEDGSVSVPSQMVCLDFPVTEKIPVSNWAIALGALLMTGFTLWILRKRS